MDSDTRISKLERTVESLRALVEGLQKQLTIGTPLGVYNPNTQVQGTITGYALVLLCQGNSALTLNFSNISTPISLSGKTLQGGVPVQLAGTTYYLAVYQ